MPPKIVRNSAVCLQCDDEIESKHRHDFQTCSCGHIFTDGGTSYIRRGVLTVGPGGRDTSIYEYEYKEND